MKLIHTIGFTQTTAKSFFEKIRDNKIKTLIDVRLNNRSQLSGFSKHPDIQFFVKELCNTEYIHDLSLAPTKELLSSYQSKKISWETYEKEFKLLISGREIEKRYPQELLDNSCLLCSEKTPHKCHRRLVTEYLSEKLDINLKTIHL